MDIRDAVVKQEQELMRDLITSPAPLNTRPVERAMAMFMEADQFLRDNGIVVKATHDQPQVSTAKQ